MADLTLYPASKPDDEIHYDSCFTSIRYMVCERQGAEIPGPYARLFLATFFALRRRQAASALAAFALNHLPE